MGFALWMDGDVAWAAGTHEYRPMGAAVVSATDLFRPRDFDRRQAPPSRLENSFVGLFASLGEVNAHLRRRRAARTGRSQPLRRKPSWL